MARVLAVATAAAVVVAGAMAVSGGAAATAVCGRIFVVNNAPEREIPSVAEFAPGATGDASPVDSITGGRNSELLTPEGIAQDDAGNTYVANLLPNLITVYAPGASGDVAPVSTLSGSNTGLVSPAGLAVQGGKLYVANGPFSSAVSVTVYNLPLAPGANNVAAVQTIAGPDTGLQVPFGIALDASGHIYVANINDSITEYAADANGDAAPMSTIVGAATGLKAPEGLAIGNGRLYAANDSNAVTAYTLPLATGANDITPVVTISGTNTGLNQPLGVALDGSDNLYVVNYGTPSVTEYASGATGDVAPIATISGPSTTLNHPQFLLVAACSGTTTSSSAPTTTTVPAGTTAFPSTVKISTGTSGGGNAASLDADDGNYFVDRSSTRTTSWFATFTGVAKTAKSLRVTYVGKQSQSANQVISMYRYSTGSWVSVDTHVVGNTDVTVGITPPGSPSDWVSGTGQMKIRIKSQATSGALTTSGDLLSVTYTT